VVISSEPVTEPAVVGDATTDMVQLWLTSNVVGQSLDCEKSPLVIIDKSDKAASPGLLRVTVSALLLVLAGVSGNVMLSVDVLNVPLTAVAFSEIVRVMAP
jgi:hypothetical protein